MEMTTKELADFLGLTPKTFKRYKVDGKIESKLEAIGWKVVSERKEGRCNIYTLEECESTTTPVKQLMNTFGVSTETFPHYYVKRTEHDEYNRCTPRFARELAEECKVARNTINEWNKKLVSLGILKPIGYFYFRIDRTTKEKTRISKEEYAMYWKSKRDESEFEYYRNEFEAGRMSAELYSRLEERRHLEVKSTEDHFCIRIKAYELQEENELHQVASKYFTEYDLQNTLIIPQGLGVE